MQFYNSADLVANEAKRSFSGRYAMLFPNGEAPLYAMSGLAKKRTITQINHGYWQRTMEFGAVTLTGSGVTTAGQTSLPVASTATITVNDVLRFSSAFAGNMFVAPENMRVVDVVSATELTVERGFSGTTPKATIAAGVIAPVVGNAYPEGSPKPPAKSIRPVYKQNYTQIFRNAWATTKTLAAIETEIGKGNVAMNRDDATNFHMRDIEMATFFSRKSMGTDPVTGQPMHTMDGIEAMIEQSAPENLIEAGDTTTYTQLIAMLDPMLDTKSSLGTTNSRTIYCGKTAFNVFNQIGRLYGDVQMTPAENSYGQRFHNFITPRGDFRIVEHPILNTNPDWQKMAVVTEMSSFDFLYLRGRDTEITFINENPQATDGQDAKSGILTTELTIEMLNPFAWGIIYGLTAGIAE